MIRQIKEVIYLDHNATTLPSDTEISMEKLTGYLLLPLAKSDKSRWLARSGYATANPERLLDDLREQILPVDATPIRSTPFGEAYEICGHLHGPSGHPISIRTIWLKQALPGRFHFVALITEPHLPK